VYSSGKIAWWATWTSAAAPQALRPGTATRGTGENISQGVAARAARAEYDGPTGA